MGQPLPSSAASRGVGEEARSFTPKTRHQDSRKVAKRRMRRWVALTRSRDSMVPSSWCRSSLGELYAGRSADSWLAEARRLGKDGGRAGGWRRLPGGRGRFLGCSWAPIEGDANCLAGSGALEEGAPRGHPSHPCFAQRCRGLRLSSPSEEGQGVSSTLRRKACLQPPNLLPCLPAERALPGASGAGRMPVASSRLG